MISYQKLRPEHAGQLVDLVLSCYGDSYSNSLLYEADTLGELIAQGQLISSVAFNDKAEMIGHVGLYWDHLDNKTPDSVTAIVREDYQRQGILGNLTKKLGPLMPARDIIGLHSYAVTTHTGSQKNGYQGGSCETGFLIPEFPASMTATGVNNTLNSERIPALSLYTPIVNAPHRQCHALAQYHPLLEDIYRRTRSPRHLLQGTAGIPAPRSNLTSEIDTRKAIERVEIHCIGEDWNPLTAPIRQRALGSGSGWGFYIDIPMSQPAAVDIMRTLKSEGWVFGCVLFERNEGDYLRMQYCNAKIDRSALHLLTDVANRLMHTVLDERDSAS